MQKSLRMDDAVPKKGTRAWETKTVHVARAAAIVGRLRITVGKCIVSHFGAIAMVRLVV